MSNDSVITFKYLFLFDDDHFEEFDIDLDPDTLAFIRSSDADIPEWASLDEDR